MIKITDQKIHAEIKNFLKIYKDRPIKFNKHGMKINHMFALYYLLKTLKPAFIIESGVFKGQGTWLIEKTLPKSKIFSIDINLNSRVFVSKKVKYLSKDFKYFNEKIDPNKTLAFFDDHTCHMDRIKHCKLLEIKNIIFEDNYKSNEGDFNSLKLIFKQQNYIHKTNFLSHIKTLYIFFIETLKKIFITNYLFDIDRINFRLRDRNNSNTTLQLKSIEKIFVFPKILKLISNKKLKKELNKDHLNELSDYNYITYVKLK